VMNDDSEYVLVYRWSVVVTWSLKLSVRVRDSVSEGSAVSERDSENVFCWESDLLGLGVLDSVSDVVRLFIPDSE